MMLIKNSYSISLMQKKKELQPEKLRNKIFTFFKNQEWNKFF